MPKNYPSDANLERNIIGAALIDQQTAVNILTELSADDFYADNYKNQRVFQAMMTLYDKQQSIDPATVYGQLVIQKDAEIIGGIDYLDSLVDTDGLMTLFLRTSTCTTFLPSALAVLSPNPLRVSVFLEGNVNFLLSSLSVINFCLCYFYPLKTLTIFQNYLLPCPTFLNLKMPNKPYFPYPVPYPTPQR
jgi:hypothetical protein